MVTAEKYDLKWNSYKNCLVNYISDHFVKDELVDVTLMCEGKTIKAHKLILSACSTYFEELFQNNQDCKPVIIMHNVNIGDLNHIINFIYNGEMRIAAADLNRVLKLGTELKIKGLSNLDKNSFHKSTSETKSKYVIESNEKRDSDNTDPKKIKEKVQITAKRPASSSEIKTSKIEGDNDNTQPVISSSSKKRKIIAATETKKDKSPVKLDTAETSSAQNKDSSSLFTPRSAFMIFANEWRKRLTVEHPNDTNKQISVRLSNMWKSLSEETKQNFYQLAQMENEKRKFPAEDD